MLGQQSLDSREHGRQGVGRARTEKQTVTVSNTHDVSGETYGRDGGHRGLEVRGVGLPL